MRIISRAPPPTRPQSLAGRDQPDGVAARSGATTLTPGELYGVIQVMGWGGASTSMTSICAPRAMVPGS